MTANPFAALLDGVPRLVFTNYGQPERFMKEDLVLAALAALATAQAARIGGLEEALAQINVGEGWAAKIARNALKGVGHEPT